MAPLVVWEIVSVHVVLPMMAAASPCGGELFTRVHRETDTEECACGNYNRTLRCRMCVRVHLGHDVY